MVHGDQDSTRFDEDSVKIVTEKPGGLCLVGDVYPGEGQKRIDEGEVGSVCVDEIPEHPGESFPYGVGVPEDREVGVEGQALVRPELRASYDVLVGLGDIPEVILGLDDDDTERSLGLDSEEVLTTSDCPMDGGLHHQG